MISQLYRESYSLQFPELSAIKNYFGEKIGFQYSFMAFYTAWLFIPALLGLAASIYQFVYQIDNIINGLYALLVCFWVTIFIERWKRKNSEIALRWGIFSMNEEEYEKRKNLEFINHSSRAEA